MSDETAIQPHEPENNGRAGNLPSLGKANTPVQLESLDDVFRLGEVLARSGFFKDARDAGKAVTKVLAGAELGLSPIAAMTGIYVVKGKITMSANVVASQIKRHPRYDYRVEELTDDLCEITFYQDGEQVGTSSFDKKDAKKAGVNNMKKFPRNMLFARAMTNGAKWYCPDVFNGPVYTPEEMGVEVDEEGQPVDVEAVAVEAEEPKHLQGPDDYQQAAGASQEPENVDYEAELAKINGRLLKAARNRQNVDHIGENVKEYVSDWPPAQKKQASQMMQRLRRVDRIWDDVADALPEGKGALQEVSETLQKDASGWPDEWIEATKDVWGDALERAENAQEAKATGDDRAVQAIRDGESALDPSEAEPLPENFPHRSRLIDAGVSTLNEVKYAYESSTLQEIDGIGPSRAIEIQKALGVDPVQSETPAPDGDNFGAEQDDDQLPY